MEGTNKAHENGEAMGFVGRPLDRRVRPRCLREAPVPVLGDGVTTSRAMACAGVGGGLVEQSDRAALRALAKHEDSREVF